MITAQPLSQPLKRYLGQGRALSIRQPWVWAIFHGGKTVENRDWSGCQHRGPLWIHASKTCTRGAYSMGVAAIQTMRADLGLPPVDVPPLADLPRGGLVGVASVVDVRRHPRGGTSATRGPDGELLSWDRGHVGFAIAGELGLYLEQVQELPLVPVTGDRGLFSLWLGGMDHEAAYVAAFEERRRR